MPEQKFQPEWFSKPGDTLRTLLDRRDLSPLALAQCLGRDTSFVYGLLSGSVSIDDSLAGQLSGCVGGSATFWKTRQQQFDEDLRRIAKAVPTEQVRAWLKVLPIEDMVASGWLPATDGPQDTFRAALTYFDVNDPCEWRERYAEFQNRFSFRTSPAFESKLGALAAWLRHGEVALFRLARALMLVLVDLAVAVRVVCAPAPVVRLGQRGISLCARTAWRPKWLTVLRYAVARRGPPQVGFAV